MDMCRQLPVSGAVVTQFVTHQLIYALRVANRKSMLSPPSLAGSAEVWMSPGRPVLWLLDWLLQP